MRFIPSADTFSSWMDHQFLQGSLPQFFRTTTRLRKMTTLTMFIFFRASPHKLRQQTNGYSEEAGRCRSKTEVNSGAHHCVHIPLLTPCPLPFMKSTNQS